MIHKTTLKETLKQGLKPIVSLCAAAMLLPATSAFADDAATYELWVASENGNRSYAMVNEQNSQAVVAEVKGDKSSVLTGAKAQQAMAQIKEAQPTREIITTKDGDVQVFTKTMKKEDVRVLELKGESDEDVKALLAQEGIDLDDTALEGKKIIIKKVQRSSDIEGDVTEEEIHEMLSEADIEWEEDGERKVIIKKSGEMMVDGDEIDVEKLLEEHGIDASDADGAKKKIIIKKMTDTSREKNIDIDVEVDEAGMVKKKVRIMKSSDAPEFSDAQEREGDVKMRKKAKRVYSLDLKDDETGMSKSFIHIKGANAEEAANFIEEIEEISAREKRRMKEAMSI